MLKQMSWHQRLLWVLRYTTWSKSQLPLESWHFTLNCAATFGIMLVIITQNGKTNMSSNRNRHINRTKSCFPPPCNVAQRNISYIRTPVDSVRVWGSDLEENKRKDFCGFFLHFFLFYFDVSNFPKLKVVYFSTLLAYKETTFVNYLHHEPQLLLLQMTVVQYHSICVCFWVSGRAENPVLKGFFTKYLEV